MMVLTFENPGTSEALAHYQIVRRDGAVVPFEPNKIAEAMMKAFLAVHGTLSERDRRRNLFDGLIHSLVEPISVWRCQIRLLALDAKQAMLIQGARVQRGMTIGAEARASVGRGFFSAAKLNLRNAP